MVAHTVTPWCDNIVLCGDSLVKQGFYPELIAAKLEKLNKHIRVVNLAVNAGTEDDAIAYLDYLRIYRCTKPRLVVFDYEVSFTGNGGGPEARAASVVQVVQPKPKNYLLEGKLSRPNSLVSSLLLIPSDVSLLVRQRGSIKHFILDFLAAFQNLRSYEVSSTLELCNVNDGGTTYCGMSPDHNLTPPNELADRNGSISHDWVGSPRHGNFRYNADRYTRIIKYCQQQQIPLMLVWMPQQNVMYDKCWYQEPYTQDWFRAQFEKYRADLFVFPVYLNTLKQDSTYYSDYKHLSTYGCMKASELLADAIGQEKYRTLIEHHPSAADLNHPQ